MTVKTFRPFVPTTRLDNGLPVPNYVTDLSQEQYAIVLETACTWFRNMEILSQTRQQATHQALSACEKAAKKLRTADAPANLLDIHAELMSFYLESPVNYWQQLAMTGLHPQVEMMARFNHLFVGNTKERMEKAVRNFQAALPTMSEYRDRKLNETAGQTMAH